MAELIDRLQATLGESYTIKSEIGGGGMSRVFVAEEMELGRTVVIKVLPPDLAAGLNADRFRREIQMAARLQHPHIVPVLSAGAKDGLLYYMMPLIQGETLRARLLRAGELPVPEAARILREVADALEYAHSNGIVHRDIKPENVLLSGNHALVMDFGVAKALSEATGQTNLTSAGVALGTPTYMSPEQATADPMTDHRSDIYSLGVLGYELLAGRPPFTGNTAQQVLAAQVTEPPVHITKHRGNIPPILGTVIMRCLEKKPADRFQRADEVREQMEIAANPTGGFTPHGTVPAKAISAGRFDTKRAGMFGAIAAVILLLALVAGRYVRGGPVYEVTDAFQVSSDAGIELTPAISPDGKLLAYASGTLSRPVIFVRQIAGGQPIRIGIGLAPQWSPDASKIVFVDDKGIAEAPAFGGAIRYLARHKGSNFFSGPAYSHDGQRIAYADRQSIIVADADGSNPKPILKAFDPHAVSWSPDDSRIAFVAGNSFFTYGLSSLGNLSPSSIWIVGSDGADPRDVTDSTHMNMSPAWSLDGDGIFFMSSLRGGRDLYYQRISGSKAVDAAQRLTTGLSIHGISVGADGAVVYSLFNARVGIWTIPIPSAGPVSVRQARTIISGSERIEAVRVSHDGQWLVFDSDRSGNSDIYRMKIDGSGLEQLTRNPADDFAPNWSPDDRQLFFHSWRGGTRDLFLMNADGSNQAAIENTPSHEWADGWSPDGRFVVFLSDRASPTQDEIFLMSVKGGQARKLATGGSPSWSPDGAVIAFGTTDGALHTIDPSGGSQKTVYRPGEHGGVREISGWSSDSKFIYFRADNGKELNIVRVNRDGSNPRLMVRFDDPERPSYRHEFGNSDTDFYFTVGRHHADIWRVRVVKK